MFRQSKFSVESLLDKEPLTRTPKSKLFESVPFKLYHQRCYYFSTNWANNNAKVVFQLLLFSLIFREAKYILKKMIFENARRTSHKNFFLKKFLYILIIVSNAYLWINWRLYSLSTNILSVRSNVSFDHWLWNRKN